NLMNSVIDGGKDGDAAVKSIGDTLKGLAGDPAKLDTFLKAANAELARNGAKVEFTSDGKGNVLLHDSWGSTAVSFDTKTGAATLVPIERQQDGTLLVKPGEIINRTPAQMMGSISDDATRGITGPHAMYGDTMKSLPFDPSKAVDGVSKKGGILNVPSDAANGA